MVAKGKNAKNKALYFLFTFAILIMTIGTSTNSLLANWGNVQISQAIFRNRELDSILLGVLNGKKTLLSDNRFILGTYYLGVKEYTKAVNVFTSLENRTNRSSIVFYQLGNAFWEINDKSKARDAWVSAGVLRIVAERKFLQGIKQYNQGKQEEAINLYEEAIDVDPSFSKGWYYLGSFYYGDRTQWPFSQEMFSNAIKTGELEHAEEILASSKISIIQGDFVMASKLIEQLVSLKPENVEGHVLYAWVSYKIGNIDTAISEYTIALSLEPNNKWTLVDLGRIYFDQGEYDLAVPFFEKALLVDSTYGSAKYWLNRVNSEVNKMK